jgi:hypothetical protein
MFASVEMFNIPSSEYKLFKLDKGYPKTATGNYVRRYGQRNSGQKLAVRDEESGEIYWLPAPNKKTFVEEHFLQNLKILNENKNGVVGQYTDAASEKNNVATLTNDQEQNLEVNAPNLMDLIRKHRDDLISSGAMQRAQTTTGRRSFTPAESESWAKTVGLVTSGNYLRTARQEDASNFLTRIARNLSKGVSDTKKTDIETEYGPADVKSQRATMGIRFENLFKRGVQFPAGIQNLLAKHKQYRAVADEIEKDLKIKNIDKNTDTTYQEIQKEKSKISTAIDAEFLKPEHAKFREELSKQYVSAATENPTSFAITTRPDIPIKIMSPQDVVSFLRGQDLRLSPGRKSGGGKIEGQVQTRTEPFASRKKLDTLQSRAQLSFGPEQIGTMSHIVGQQNVPELEMIQREMYPRKK